MKPPQNIKPVIIKLIDLLAEDITRILILDNTPTQNDEISLRNARALCEKIRNIPDTGFTASQRDPIREDIERLEESLRASDAPEHFLRNCRDITCLFYCFKYDGSVNDTCPDEETLDKMYTAFRDSFRIHEVAATIVRDNPDLPDQHRIRLRAAANEVKLDRLTLTGLTEFYKAYRIIPIHVKIHSLWKTHVEKVLDRHAPAEFSNVTNQLQSFRFANQECTIMRGLHPMNGEDLDWLENANVSRIINLDVRTWRQDRPVIEAMKRGFDYRHFPIAKTYKTMKYFGGLVMQFGDMLRNCSAQNRVYVTYGIHPYIVPRMFAALRIGEGCEMGIIYAIEQIADMDRTLLDSFEEYEKSIRS